METIGWCGWAAFHRHDASLPPAAGDPVFHLDRDRPASIVECLAHLLFYCLPHRLG